MEQRVLILANSPSDVELIELQLKKAGLAVATRRVASEEMFRKTVAERRPDLVIADTAIPRFEIGDALRLGRGLIPGVPWIIFGGNVGEEQIAAFFHAGAADFVSRKFYTRLGPAAKRALELRAQVPEPPPAAPAPTGRTSNADEQHDCFYRQVLDHISDLVAVVNREGRRVYNNAAYKDLLEDPEILVGTDSFLDIHPEDQELVRRVLHETLLTGTGQRIEYRLMDRSGTNRSIESHGSILPDEDGEVSRVVIVSRDITERKRSRDILQALLAVTASTAGDEFYRALVRGLAFAFGSRYALVSQCVDGECRRVRALAYWVGDDWSETFEYDVDGTVCESILRDGISAFHASGIQDRFPQETALVTLQAESYAGVPLLGAGGRPVGHMFIMDTLPMSDDSLPLGVMSLFAPRVAAEIERAQVAGRSARAAEQERLILDALVEAVLVTDTSNIITHANEQARLLTGYAPRELMGHVLFSLLTPGEDPALLQQRIARCEQGLEDTYQTKLRCKDDSACAVSVHARPYCDVDGRLAGSVLTLRETGSDAWTRPVSGLPPESATDSTA